MKTSQGPPHKKNYFDSIFLHSFIKLLQFINLFFFTHQRKFKDQ